MLIMPFYLLIQRGPDDLRLLCFFDLGCSKRLRLLENGKCKHGFFGSRTDVCSGAELRGPSSMCVRHRLPLEEVDFGLGNAGFGAQAWAGVEVSPGILATGDTVAALLDCLELDFVDVGTD
jgi:hypothetical protein